MVKTIIRICVHLIIKSEIIILEYLFLFQVIRKYKNI